MSRRRYMLVGGIAAGLVLSLLLGVVLCDLSEIPFGTLFNLTLLLLGVALAVVLFLAGILLVRSRRLILKWLAVFPWMLAIVVVLLPIIILVDVRILYFQSLPPRPSATEWVEDLRFLAGQMSSKHRDLHALVSEERWTEVLRESEQRIASLQEPDIVMELFRLSALPNDNHTFPFVMAPCFDLHSFPFIVYGFPEGWHIVRAGRGYEDLVGARLLQIGKQSIEEIYDRYPLLLAAENFWSRRERFTYVVMMAEWLAYHKIIDDINEAEFTVQNQDGTERVIRVSPVQFNLQFRWSGLNAIANDRPPVFTNPRQDAYTSRTLAEGRVLYVQLNQCIDQPGRETAAEFAHSLERFLDTTRVDRCIVDLRNNDGGNDVFDELLRVLRDHTTISRRGRLFVLIGRRTQSAAVRFATQLQMQTNALFLGEPTGQGPIFYGGPTLVELPHSGLLFGVSTHLAVAGLPVDHREAIEPDIPVAFGIRDFLEGRDPVLSVALEYEVPDGLNDPRGGRDLQAFAGRYVLGDTLVLDVHEEEGTLRVRLTDFLPGSRIRFLSELRREFGRRFATHMKNVVIDFPGVASEAAPRAMLLWMGAPLVFERAVADSALAFELFSRGEVMAGCERIRSEVEKYRRTYPDLERHLNRLGYLYLRGGDTHSALDVFYLNLELFPESYNVYDSYGEALMVDGKIDSAIVNYRRSLELNPKNANAARVIERLTEL